jgi:hypothetical protein
MIPMMRFDPTEKRGQLLGDLGIKRTLADDIEGYRANGAISNCAMIMTNEAVSCYLVGLRDVGRLVAEKAQSWLLTAIEEHEVSANHYIRYGDEASRLQQLAMCRWLLYGKQDHESLDQSVELEDLFHGETDYPREHVDSAVDAYLAAGKSARVVELYESVRLARPSRWIGIRNAAQLAYMIARHRLGAAFSADEVRVGVRKALTLLLPELLGSGAYFRAARWMKITAWDGQPDSAYGSLMSCYDYLDGLRRPAF